MAEPQATSTDTAHRALPPPTWDTADRHGYRRGLALVWQRCTALFQQYVVLRGNNARYLRSLGARIGEQCEILTSADSFGSEPWLIELGSRVTISQGVVFITHDGASRLFRHQLPGSAPWGNRFGSIRIYDNSFVGANATLLPNIEIGPNSIVGAGSLVNHTVAAETVVAGVPARVICTLAEYIERYKAKAIPITATTRQDLRQELTQRFWGERR